MARKRQRKEHCPNCDTALPEGTNFCPNCGQENHTHKLPVRHFIIEWLSGMFNFDTKLLRTLRDLVWPPGTVIREFNANRRIRYVHPLRIYLFTSLLFFLLVAVLTSSLQDGEGPAIVVNGSEVEQADGLRLELGDGSSVEDSTLVALSAYNTLTNELIDSTLLAHGAMPSLINRTVIRLALNLSGNSLRKEAFVQQLFSSFSKVLFALVPLFAALLMGLFWRTGKFYTEHLVFALYFHTFLFLLLGMSMAIDQWSDVKTTTTLLPVLAMVHLVWSVRTVHGRGWWGSIWRGMLLSILYSILVLVGLAAAAIISSL
ncbi:MAG: DUF3667 domain-containing protein [Flavobacteriales bacterium]|nr:DUF3667 domain-containing protein [Flavobacteriales bacterium]